MTPFDPAALLAMLLAFYEPPSAAAFRQARRERPEYFAGGVIIGSKGDKLQLGDGRIFDCIVSAGGPIGSQRWQCVDVTNDPGGPVDPFALDAGPLVPLDEAMPLFPDGGPNFAALVTDHLRAFDGADDVLAQAGQDAIAYTGAGDLEDSYARDVEPALAAHVEIRAALDADDPIDLIGATNGQDPEIDAARGDYTEAPPPDTPGPDPGNRPGDDGPTAPGPRPAE